jgi:hypothetical protein
MALPTTKLHRLPLTGALTRIDAIGRPNSRACSALFRIRRAHPADGERAASNLRTSDLCQPPRMMQPTSESARQPASRNPTRRARPASSCRHRRGSSRRCRSARADAQAAGAGEPRSVATTSSRPPGRRIGSKPRRHPPRAEVVGIDERPHQLPPRASRASAARRRWRTRRRRRRGTRRSRRRTQSHGTVAPVEDLAADLRPRADDGGGGRTGTSGVAGREIADILGRELLRPTLSESESQTPFWHG